MNELILKKENFEGRIVEVINNSELPAFVVRPILKELLEQISILEQRQSQEAQVAKKEETKKQEEETENDNEEVKEAE